jgi:phosphatidylserine/phosphatidylglycerophosphate/cardiolipin synthase-like enzyme
MKPRGILFVGLAFLVLLAISSIPYLTDWGVNRAPVKISGSSAAERGNAMIAQISKARSEILVEARSFTSVDMAKALVDAARRGVSIAVILDKDQQEIRQYALARYLANSKITTYVDAQRAISPDSFMIVDGETVIAGSFDSTPAPQKRRTENVVVAQSGDLAKTYLASWNNHKANSRVYNIQ